MKEIKCIVYYCKKSVNEKLKTKEYKTIEAAVKYANSCNYAHVECFGREIYNNYPSKKGYTESYYQLLSDLKEVRNEM